MFFLFVDSSCVRAKANSVDSSLYILTHLYPRLCNFNSYSGRLIIAMSLQWFSTQLSILFYFFSANTCFLLSVILTMKWQKVSSNHQSFLQHSLGFQYCRDCDNVNTSEKFTSSSIAFSSYEFAYEYWHDISCEVLVSILLLLIYFSLLSFLLTSSSLVLLLLFVHRAFLLNFHRRSSDNKFV